MENKFDGFEVSHAEKFLEKNQQRDLLVKALQEAHDPISKDLILK